VIFKVGMTYGLENVSKRPIGCRDPGDIYHSLQYNSNAIKGECDPGKIK
jgi:hypothetical protein